MCLLLLEPCRWFLLYNEELPILHLSYLPLIRSSLADYIGSILVRAEAQFQLRNLKLRWPFNEPGRVF